MPCCGLISSEQPIGQGARCALNTRQFMCRGVHTFASLRFTWFTWVKIQLSVMVLNLRADKHLLRWLQACALYASLRIVVCTALSLGSLYVWILTHVRALAPQLCIVELVAVSCGLGCKRSVWAWPRTRRCHLLSNAMPRSRFALAHINWSDHWSAMTVH